MSQEFAEISAEAKAFLVAAEPLPPAPSALDELKVMRDLTLDGFRAAAEQVREECVEDIAEVELGGVRT